MAWVFGDDCETKKYNGTIVHSRLLAFTLNEGQYQPFESTGTCCTPRSCLHTTQLLFTLP